VIATKPNNGCVEYCEKEEIVTVMCYDHEEESGNTSGGRMSEMADIDVEKDENKSIIAG
jgi:hypothetical protein